MRAGTPTELTFKAYATGRFLIAVHTVGGPPSGGVSSETPLVYLEVVPR